MPCCGYSDIFEIMTGKRDKTEVEQMQTSTGIGFEIMFYRVMYITNILTNCHQNSFFFKHIFTFQEIKTSK